ncbi:FAD-dependent monooxygenase [Nonomuraea sp. NPDC050663]|uniref:FAD-dependent monooxygenase n=1 Tax=Nonomuraea sp. NPDC050663 TaxID=3364370 RepID=UPI0037ADB3CB
MDVVISGAGIAGPALAWWLVRSGHRVCVVERAASLRSGGQAVDFRGRVQLGVLERMGLLEAVRERQTRMGAIAIVDERGRRVSSVPAQLFAGDVEILRGDLVRVLYEATRDDVDYVFGDTVAEFGGGRVRLASGGERPADLVVGADGLRSGVRRLAFGPVEPVHLGMYGALFTVAGSGEPGTATMFNAPGVGAGVFHYEGRSVGSLDFASPVVADPRAALAGRLVGAGWRVPELLAQALEAGDLYLDAAAQLRLERWSAGPVVLVGDAAWSPGPGGMGTGLGVVGAYVLAGELARGAEGFAGRYEAALRPYVEVCQKQALGSEAFLVPGTRRGIWARNQMFRMLPYVPWRGVVRWMATKAAEKVSLADYASE